MNLVFIIPLKHAGLSLAIGLGACLNAGLLLYQLRKQGIYQPQDDWGRFARRLLLAVLVMAEVLLALNWGSPFDWAHQPALTRTLWLTAMVVMGVIVYFGMLYAQGFRLADFRRKEH